jgi:hypothetical protein
MAGLNQNPDLLLAQALQRATEAGIESVDGELPLTTGRKIVTFKEGARRLDRPQRTS